MGLAACFFKVIIIAFPAPDHVSRGTFCDQVPAPFYAFLIPKPVHRYSLPFAKRFHSDLRQILKQGRQEEESALCYVLPGFLPAKAKAPLQEFSVHPGTGPPGPPLPGKSTQYLRGAVRHRLTRAPDRFPCFLQ